MTIALTEITADQVIGLNQSIIEQAHLWNPRCRQKHAVRDKTGLQGTVGGVFQKLQHGYVHLPLEKMAGLLLYRIAQGQHFVDGNKRTALLSAVVFLGNNGNGLNSERGKTNDLLWGFATPQDNPKYGESEAIKFIEDNTFVLP